MEFDGTDDYVDCGSDASLDITGPITVAAWIHPDSISTYQEFVSKGDWAGGSGYYFTYYMLIMNTGTVRFGTHGSGSDPPKYVDSAPLADTGQWYHVAATFDPTSDYAAVYVDGVQTTGTITHDPLSSPHPVYIGALKDSANITTGTINEFDGFIDEVRIYNEALTAGEIEALQNCGIEVEIDIKPGSYPNSINLKDQGVLPVAILGSSIDVSTIDLSEPITLGGTTVTSRGPAKAPKLAVSFEDVDGDGLMDLVAFFRVQDLVTSGALDETTTELMLEAETTGDVPIQGTDTVNVVPPDE